MSETPSLATEPSFFANRAAQRRIAASAVLLALVGGLYGIFAPSWYRSELVLVPGKAQKSGGLSGLLGGDLGGLAAGLDPSMGGGVDPARIAAVLRSNAVTDAVIEKFDLRTRYDELLYRTAKYQEVARDSLWRHCSVKVVQKPNLVELSCEDKDPRFVQEMLRYFSEYGNDVFRRVNVGSASEEVRYLEKRVADLRPQAELAATRMREFQEKHQIVDLDSQARAVVSSMAALHGQRIGRQMELGYAERFSSPEEAGTQQLRSKISVVDETLRGLERPAAANAKGTTGMFPPSLDVPRLRAEFEQLFRDRKVAETTLLYGLERLEGARANEARDMSTFYVLDPPTLPTKKSRPRALETALYGAILGLAAGVLFEWVQSRQRRNISS
jgi:capsule polysaccharide export protein KpsE/RkpR